MGESITEGAPTIRHDVIITPLGRTHPDVCCVEAVIMSVAQIRGDHLLIDGFAIRRRREEANAMRYGLVRRTPVQIGDVCRPLVGDGGFWAFVDIHDEEENIEVVNALRIEKRRRKDLKNANALLMVGNCFGEIAAFEVLQEGSINRKVLRLSVNRWCEGNGVQDEADADSVGCGNVLVAGVAILRSRVLDGVNERANGVLDVVGEVRSHEVCRV